LAAAAQKLSKGQISTVIKPTSGNGYYYVKLDDSNDSQIQYEYIFVPLKDFTQKLAAIKQEGKLQTFIKVEQPATSQPAAQ